MNAVILTELFKGNQLEEIRFWMDNESPYFPNSGWERSIDGSHMIKMCGELNMLHMWLTDTARDVFAIHNLLPTFSTLSWYQERPLNKHYDTGPVEHTILYNYFSERELVLEYDGQELIVPNEQAIAYSGQQFEHYVKSDTGISICMYFNYASPDNHYFALGQHNKQGHSFPSGRQEHEVVKDWL